MSESGNPAGLGAQLKALVGPSLPYMVELLVADHIVVDTDHIRRTLAT